MKILLKKQKRTDMCVFFSEETVLQRWPVFHWESNRVINYRILLPLLTLLQLFPVLFIFVLYFLFVSISLGLIFVLTTPTAPSSPTPPPHSRQILFCFLFNLVSPDAKAVDVVTMSAEGTMVALFVRWPGPRICFSLGSCGPPPKSTCEKN